jgi:Tfp pilus assembly protein PilN
MIEINLARQLQVFPADMGASNRGYGWVGVVLCLGIGLASWWWTQIQQQEYKNLLQEKHVQTQSLAKIQTTLSRLEQYQEEKQLLSNAFEVMHAQKLGKKQPLALLDGVSRSVDGLEIWLDRVQMVGQVVELRGQSFAPKEIGKYIDALENHQVITSLPVVEILDQKDRETGKIFSFMIRFIFGQQVAT